MKQFVVDAFADAVFTGNPAAVCVPGEWPAPELMAKIAVENNLSETAFLVAWPHRSTSPPGVNQRRP